MANVCECLLDNWETERSAHRAVHQARPSPQWCLSDASTDRRLILDTHTHTRIAGQRPRRSDGVNIRSPDSTTDIDFPASNPIRFVACFSVKKLREIKCLLGSLNVVRTGALLQAIISLIARNMWPAGQRYN